MRYKKLNNSTDVSFLEGMLLEVIHRMVWADSFEERKEIVAHLSPETIIELSILKSGKVKRYRSKAFCERFLEIINERKYQ